MIIIKFIAKVHIYRVITLVIGILKSFQIFKLNKKRNPSFAMDR
jgi:hypothetical protein